MPAPRKQQEPTRRTRGTEPPERTVPKDPLAFIVRCVREHRVYWTYPVNMRLAGRHISRRDICEATDTYLIEDPIMAKVDELLSRVDRSIELEIVPFAA